MDVENGKLRFFDSWPGQYLLAAYQATKRGIHAHEDRPFLGFDARGGVGWAVLRYCPEEALWVWQEILDFRVAGAAGNHK